MASKYAVQDPTNYVGLFDDTNEVDGDEDKEKNDDDGLSWWEKRKQSVYGPGIEGGKDSRKRRGEDDDEDESKKKHVIFDFRRGNDGWPEGVTVVGGEKIKWRTEKDQSKSIVLETKQRLHLPLKALKEAAGYWGVLDSFTITIDLKLPEESENRSISLFQSKLKRKDGTSTDGEAIVNGDGGVGMFGNYGDVSKVKVERGKRQRIVIAVENSGDGTMSTYVDGKLCATITRSGAFVPGERFSLDCDVGVYMFSSGKEDYMVGGISVQMIRIDSYCMDEAEVRDQRMRDRIFNIWDEERKKEAKEMQKGLSLKPLYARPPPIWLAPAFNGLLADAFVQGTILEGGVIGSAFSVLQLATTKMLARVGESDATPTKSKEDAGGSFFANFDRLRRSMMTNGLAAFTRSEDIFRWFRRLRKNPNNASLLSFLRKLGRKLEAVGVGEIVVLPVVIETNETVILLERETRNKFRMVVVNTDPRTGLKYHPVKPAAPPVGKLKYRTCLVFDNLPKRAALDQVFWMAVYRMVRGKRGDTDKFYDVVLPFLTGKPLESSLAETEEAAEKNESSIDWRSPQKAANSSVRALMEGLHYVLRKQGMSVIETKQVALGIRSQFVRMCYNDMRYVPLDSDSRFLINVAVRQLAYTAAKHSKAIGNPSETSSLLRDTYNLCTRIQENLKAFTIESNTPKFLELKDSDVTTKETKKDSQPFRELLAWDVEDPMPDPGQSSTPNRYIPVDFLQLPVKANNLKSAIHAICRCEQICTLIEAQQHCVKNKAQMVACAIEHVFTQIVPMPKPRDLKGRVVLMEGESESETCIWSADVTYAQQLEAIHYLRRIMEHFIAAIFSVVLSRSFDATRIVVPACILAVADVIMRKRATDRPSEVCTHLFGETRDGDRKVAKGFGVSIDRLAKQSETIEVHSPELHVARTAVLDYFLSPYQTNLDTIFPFEEGHWPKPGKHTIRWIRNICRERGFQKMNPHYFLLTRNPENNHVPKNHYEFHAFKDIVWLQKMVLNADPKDVPPIGSSNYNRMQAQCLWYWDSRNACYQVNLMGRRVFCEPLADQKDKDGNKLTFEHRFPSTATPSFYVESKQEVKREDDVLYVQNLPSFEDKYGQVLGQRDSELLISYLTVPYLRIPLVVSFFATEDRVHKLQSEKLRAILDSVLFEPHKYLPVNLTHETPTMVPTRMPELLATSFGLLLNELVRSPNNIVNPIMSLLKAAVELDTGSVCDEGASEMNMSVSIILYVMRVAMRVDNYISFVVQYHDNSHQCIKKDDRKLRNLDCSRDTIKELVEGRKCIRGWLFANFKELLLSYISKLDRQCTLDPANEELIDRNSRISCDLHAHLLLLYRNLTLSELEPSAVKSLLGSFVFLTTRHTWNKATRESGQLLLPETELYELLHVQRRRIVTWLRKQKQGILDDVMQYVLISSTSGSAGDRSADSAAISSANRWAKISAPRNVGRFAVSSTRTLAREDARSVAIGADSDNGPPPSKAPMLKKQRSFESTVTEVSDTSNLGVEVDVQIAQLTLRSAHLSALNTQVASHRDVRMVFGERTMQASLMMAAEKCQIYKIVGLDYELHHWVQPHDMTPPLPDGYERDYSPGELCANEKWIMREFEPVRRSFFDGPNPPPLQFIMPTKEYPADAEVAVLIGLHPTLHGPYKLVYVFRRLKCVHVYEAVSHGRVWNYTLHLTSDARFCLREMQPFTGPRKQPMPEWFRFGAGTNYPKPPGAALFDDIVGEEQKDQDASRALLKKQANRNGSAPLFGGASPFGSTRLRQDQSTQSVVIVRSATHPENSSGGKEYLVPNRFLYGLIPQCLLVQFRYWRDETGVFRGYPLALDPKTGDWQPDPEGDHIVIVELRRVPRVRATGLKGRVARVTRYSRRAVLNEFRRRQRLASSIEAYGLLRAPKKKKKEAKDADGENPDELDPEKIKAKQANTGEGVWVWAGLSDEEDEAWEGEEEEDDDEDGKKKKEKYTVTASQLARMNVVLAAANWDERAAETALAAIAASAVASTGGASKASKIDENAGTAVATSSSVPFTSLNDLADAVRRHVGSAEAFEDTRAEKKTSDEGDDAEKEERTKKSGKDPRIRTLAGEETQVGETWIDAIDDKDAVVLLNLMYARRGSKLHSVARTLSRIENLSHIAAWVNLSKIKSTSTPTGACPPIDRIELPRMKLTLREKMDFNGVSRLYSVDHADLFVCNENGPQINQLLSGIPHSLVMRNTQGEKFILVSTAMPVRPEILLRPFSTRLVLDRNNREWTDAMSTGYYVYPVHVSLSFMITTGLNTALYLMLLRFLARDYQSVAVLAESIATDTSFSTEERAIFGKMGAKDLHPDAHASRIKISLMTLDSRAKAPWNLTFEMAGYITKLSHISANCRLSLKDETQMLSSGKVVLDEWSPMWDPKKYSLYDVTLLRNRSRTLKVWTKERDNLIHSDDDRKVTLDIPPRTIDSGWPYYVDNTVFGKEYAKPHAIDNDKDLVAFVQNNGKSVHGKMFVLFFGASWSQACERMAYSVAELAAANPGVFFLKIKADDESLRELISFFKIVELPSFVYLRVPDQSGVAATVSSKVADEKTKEGTEDGNVASKVEECAKNVVSFASALKLLRDAASLGRFSGESRGKLGRMLVKNLQESDKVDVEDHAENAMDAVAAEEASRVWYWDVSNCGPNFKVANDGLTAKLKVGDDDDDDDAKQAIWEYKYEGFRSWKQLDPFDSAKLEEIEVRQLWKQGQQSVAIENNAHQVYINSTMLGDYKSAGEIYDNRGSLDGGMIRRRLPGQTFPEDDGAKEDQDDDEEKSTKKDEKDSKKEDFEPVLDSIEALRGAVGWSRGVHEWKLLWKHEPNWMGLGDAVGVCTRDCGSLGPQPLPCLGEDNQSWAIHAAGEIWHGGKVVGEVPLSSRKHVPKDEKGEEDEVDDDDDEDAKETGGGDSKTDGESKSDKSEGKSVCPLVWGKGCRVVCILDCDESTFSLRVNGKVVPGAIVKDLPKGVKLYPILSSCLPPPESKGRKKEPTSKKQPPIDPNIILVRKKTAAKKKDAEEKTTTAAVAEGGAAKASTPSVSPPISGAGPPSLSVSDSKKQEVIFGWQWKRTDKSIWHYFDERPEKEIEELYKKKTTSWSYKYDWKHEGWTELPADEKGWRLSVCHNNPKSGNVYKSGNPYYYVIRRIDGGPMPSREGDARWMHESEQGWQVYSQARSDEIEEAWQEKKSAVTIMIDGKTFNIDLKHLQQVEEVGGSSRGASDSQMKRVRRQQLSEGIQRLWQVLSVSFAPPYWLRGANVLEIFDKVWQGTETMSGDTCKLGFLFLYNMLSGRMRVRITGGNDSHRLATLMSQLFFDRKEKSLMNSVVNVLARNPAFCARLPRFKDTRKLGRIPRFNGWTDDKEPISPLHNLFSALVPQLRKYGDAKIVRYPPPPPHPSLPSTQSTFVVPSYEERLWLKPRISNFGCEKRRFGPLGIENIVKLSKRCKVTLGGSSGQNAPILVRDLDHFGRLLLASTSSQKKREGGAIVVVDFFAPWCGPCKAAAPMYHEIATRTPASIASFLKVNCDENDDIAKAFEIKSFPTFKILRVPPPKAENKESEGEEKEGGGVVTTEAKTGDDKSSSAGQMNAEVVESFEGVPKNFGRVLVEGIFKSLSSEDQEAIEEAEKQRKSEMKARAEGSGLDAITARDSSALATLPLQSLLLKQPMVVSETRKEQGLDTVDESLPFELSGHPQSKSHIAKLMCSRMEKDTKEWADIANAAKATKISFLRSHHLDKMLSTTASGEKDVRRQIDEASRKIDMFVEKLKRMKEADSMFVSEVLPLATEAANFVHLMEPANADLASKIEAAPDFEEAASFEGSRPGRVFKAGSKGLGYYKDKSACGAEMWSAQRLHFSLRRIAGQEAIMWPQFLFASMLSTRFKEDTQRMNPYLHDSDVGEIVDLLIATVMRSSRIGHINRCSLAAVKLQSLLRKVPDAATVAEKSTLRVKLEQSSASFAKLLMTRRQFMVRDKEKRGSWTFDPRYLVFEFTWNILLRPKQYVMVTDFVETLKKGDSKVKQLIMGAGKTAVVTPLLALMMGDGKSLVVVMVPKALLDQSRKRLRETFSSVVTKRIYTIQYDRSSSPNRRFVDKLENAIEASGVCVCTPTSVKSIMLAYVETLGNIAEGEGFRGNRKELKKDVKNLKRILSYFQEGVALIDEVDLVLHPLKSELNFPIGDKFELDMSASGERWGLPIHLMDAIFFRTRQRSAVFDNSTLATSILRRISTVVEEGVKARAIQENPHVVLLNHDWYHARMKPLMAEWAYLWLQSVHLHGVSKEEVLQYLLKGAAARSASGRRKENLETRRLKLETKLGLRAPGPTSSDAWRESIGEEKLREETKRSDRLKRQASDELEDAAAAALSAQLDVIKASHAQAEKEHDLIESVYNAEAAQEKSAREHAKLLEARDKRISDVKSKIDAIENPHDESLDNTVVIWVSKFFMDPSDLLKIQNDDEERKCVNQSIAKLESDDLIVRRVDSNDEAISMARSLLKQGRLRCVITDQWRETSFAGVSLVNELIEGAKSGSRGDDVAKMAIPAARLAVYDHKVRSSESKRLIFWQKGVVVANDDAQLLGWISDIPLWPDQIESRRKAASLEAELCDEGGRVVILDNAADDELIRLQSIVLWCRPDHDMHEADSRAWRASEIDKLRNMSREEITVQIVKASDICDAVKSVPTDSVLSAVVLEPEPLVSERDARWKKWLSRKKCTSKSEREQLKTDMAKEGIEGNEIEAFMKPKMSLIDEKMEKFLDIYCVASDSGGAKKTSSSLLEHVPVVCARLRDYNVAIGLEKMYRVKCPPSQNSYIKTRELPVIRKCKTCESEMLLNPQMWNTCDWCRKTGTQYRCSSGCDVDMCQKCFDNFGATDKNKDTFEIFVETEADQECLLEVIRKSVGVEKPTETDEGDEKEKGSATAAAGSSLTESEKITMLKNMMMSKVRDGKNNFQSMAEGAALLASSFSSNVSTGSTMPPNVKSSTEIISSVSRIDMGKNIGAYSLKLDLTRVTEPKKCFEKLIALNGSGLPGGKSLVVTDRVPVAFEILVAPATSERMKKDEEVEAAASSSLRSIGDTLKAKKFDVTFAKDVKDVLRVCREDGGATAVIGMASGQLSQQVFKAVKSAIDPCPAILGQISAGHKKGPGIARSLDGAEAMLKGVVGHIAANRDAKRLQRLHTELEKEEAERSREQTVADRAHGEARKQVSGYHEELLRVLNSRIAYLTKQVEARQNKVSGSTKMNEADEAAAVATVRLTPEDLAVEAAIALASGENDGIPVLRKEIEHLKRTKLAATIMANVTFDQKKLLNLAHDWLLTFLPHCMKKINRVSFGMLNAEDCRRALAKDPLMPRTRLKLAVPFLGKDVPSASSEFAHPDVIIGMTILAYRYSGLRYDDFANIVDAMTSNFTREIGPSRERESSRKHEIWVLESGGTVRGINTPLKGYTPSKFAQECAAEAKAAAERRRRAAASSAGGGKKRSESEKNADDAFLDREVVQLKYLKKSNEEQMRRLYALWKDEPLVIHEYLQRFIFPAYMKSQKVKISASGQAVGGEMLFNRRVGFSGTPSDLMPKELGRCDFAKGDDGQMLANLTDTSVTSFEYVEDRWKVDTLLKKIAGANPRYHALIDTGALITGYNNEQVARKLLALGLTWCDGVVFLDAEDRKKVLVRATDRVVPADQCGIPLERRFAFYDQIHTTGMDIKHVVNACAVLTLGKDMVFRDFAQGAFRMRGIAVGQRIHVYVIPEVRELIEKTLRCGVKNRVVEKTDDKLTTQKKVLVDIAAWLVINSMMTERIQWNMLCIQNVSNVYRKNAFRAILDTAFAERTIKSKAGVQDSKEMTVFNEQIDFALEAGVPDPVRFADKIRNLVDDHKDLIEKESEIRVCEEIMREVGEYDMLDESGKTLDQEQEREQQQEQQREVKARRDQEIEVEKFVDAAYRRDNETPTPWHISELSKSAKDMEHFYSLSQFHLHHRRPLTFPSNMLISNNHFNAKWTGLRRVKNVIMVLEWVPNPKSVRPFDSDTAELSKEQALSLKKSFELFKFDPRKETAGLSMDDLAHSVRAIKSEKIDESELKKLAETFGSSLGAASESIMNFEGFRHMLMKRTFCPRDDGRYFVAVSLAEAETIRRILHGRGATALVKGSDAQVALRCIPANNCIFDKSAGWKAVDAESSYQVKSAHALMRFFDCDMHFDDMAVSQIIRGVQAASTIERERWFLSTIGARRRLTRKWTETPLAKVFTVSDEWALLKQRAICVFLRESLKRLGLTVWDSFNAIDHDDNGILAPEEIFGAIRWMRAPGLTEDDIMDFVEAVDKERKGAVSYKEFLDLMRDPDAKDDADDEAKDESAVRETPPPALNKPPSSQIKLPSHMKPLAKGGKVEPQGKDALRAIIIARKRAEARRQRDYKAQLEMERQKDRESAEESKSGAPSLLVRENPVIVDGESIVFHFDEGTKPTGVRVSGKATFQSLCPPKKTYLKCESGSIKLPLPSSEWAELKSWSISAQVKFDTLPPHGSSAVLFQFGRVDESLRKQHGGAVYVRADGSVGVRGGTSSPSSAKMTAGTWATVNVSVDVRAGVLSTFVDGDTSEVATHLKAPDLTNDATVFLFGSKMHANDECRGGSIATFAFVANKALRGPDLRESSGVAGVSCRNVAFANASSRWGEKSVSSILRTFEGSPLGSASQFLRALSQQSDADIDVAYKSALASMAVSDGAE